MESFRDWPDGWAILFATFAHGGRIYGKVRLNKYLAILQREGFPVPNRFENHQMGPHDWHIDDEASRLVSSDLLLIEKQPSGKPLERVEYHITARGVQFVRQSIFPRIDVLPFGASIRTVIVATTHLFRNHTDEIVKSLHKDLYLDDHQAFVKHLYATADETKVLMESVESSSSEDCELCMDLLGTLEFSLRALSEIRQSHLDDGLTGKHNVLFNAERLEEIVRDGIKHRHTPFVDDSSPAEDRILSERLKHRLHCLEYNADLYGILTPIDPYTYPFPEFVVAQ